MRALVLVLVAGCTAAPPPVALQMNDLSVLLPLPRTEEMALAPMAPAQGGVLFPEAMYAASGASVNYSSLHVVAFRLDPCFGATCQPQLRVVFQPMAMTTEGTVVAQDAAIHAFYALTTEQLLDAVGEVAQARRDDNGDVDLGPLAPHPVVARESLAGRLALAFDAILLKYAGAANLMRFTTLQLEFPNLGDLVGGDGEVWELEAFDVAGGVATRKQIPTLDAGRTTMSFQAAAAPLSATFSPLTTSTDNSDLLVNYMQATQATPAARQLAFDAALRIENPRDNSPNTIDCASCHMAEPARQLVGEPLGLTATGNANAFVPDAAIPVADLAATTHVVDANGNLNIHAFSYSGTEPMINQRVIDETAANLAYVAMLMR